MQPQAQQAQRTATTWPLPAAELKPALELALGVMRADMGILMLRDDAENALVPVIGSGMTDAQCASIGNQRLGDGLFGRALTEQRRVVVRDAWLEGDGLSTFARQVGARGLEILPLRGSAGDSVGAITVMYRHRRGANERAVRLVEYCAQLVVSALSHARLQIAAERASDRLQQAERDRDELIARSIHELRTLLQSISGYTELLRLDQGSLLNPDQLRFLSRLRSSEQMVVHVIDDLLTFSKLEAGQVSFQIAPTLVPQAMELAETIVAPIAAERGIRINVTRCPPDTWVLADADKLAQVLVNLAMNGVKFTDRGGSVRFDCVADPRFVHIRVTDTGRGIPADRLGDIFKPYVQLEHTPHSVLGGSGLGLAISHEFATAMGGTLGVTSSIGRGSVFTLTLPRAPFSRTAHA